MAAKNNACTICGKPGIPGLTRGSGKCQYHYNLGQFGQVVADKARRKKFSVIYLDTCLPDYFHGYGGEVYAVPLWKGARNGEVMKSLIQEVNGRELWVDGESAPEYAYEQLLESARELFKKVDGRMTFNAYAGDESYAYFGVRIDEE